MAARLALSVAVLAALAGAGAGCDEPSDGGLLVVVTASGSPPAVKTLRVKLSILAASSTAVFERDDQRLISFPTTLAATLPATTTGDVTVDIDAQDAAGATVASGREGPLPLRAGERRTIYVQLDCGGGPCVTPGDGTDGGPPPPSPRCGNGRLDLGESCDTAIRSGEPGACPPADCNDGAPCTRDIHSGAGCTATCAHEEITGLLAGDGCCPSGADHRTDSECSATCGNGAVDLLETCDVAIAAGAPGACPDGSCVDNDPCARVLLSSAGTCAALCTRYPVTATPDASPMSDGCCPAGATNAIDRDCPIVCGNGVREEGESCDVAIPALTPGSCGTRCTDDDACTTDFFVGFGCQAMCVHIPITTWTSGDGCCPPTATSATDTDCPARCGNGVLERGEACENGISDGPLACPTACPRLPSACLKSTLAGNADDCSARCVTTAITACSGRTEDGCCPAGCTRSTDTDCSITCGDGALQVTQGETCDVLIPAGQPGSCPTTCTSNNPCQEARLVSAGTCAASCVLLPTTVFRAGDGCCPPGGNFTVDTDCPMQCGNGIVESPAEPCDYAVEGSCPAALMCPPVDKCTQQSFKGASAMCTAVCVSLPISGCLNNDACCPAGCTAANDNDCPAICGDGVLEAGERCDRAITAGAPGACARACDDHDACTADVTSGSAEGCSRTCSHRAITACLPDDGCCPSGCTAQTDLDCDAHCNNLHVDAGETCDPPTTCPTSCPDDGDPCTIEELTGSPSSCDAACWHRPVTSCSGSRSDVCCPTSCTTATDIDC